MQETGKYKKKKTKTLAPDGPSPKSPHSSEVNALFRRHHERHLIDGKRYRRLFTPNDLELESSLSFVGTHNAIQLAVEFRPALDALQEWGLRISVFWIPGWIEIGTSRWDP